MAGLARVAVITGGGTGIGRAVASDWIQAGGIAWIVGRREEVLEEASLALGSNARAFAGDVVDAEAMANLGRAIRERDGGAVHLLVNNAAILGPVETLPNYAAEDFEEVMRINVCGTFVPTQALLPLLRAGGPGSVVINLSSGVGRRGRGGWGAYCASKFAVEGLTQVWADELAAWGIAVHALNPGATRTNMRAQAKPDEDPTTLPTPEDLLPSFRYLWGEELRASATTGLSIDSRDFFPSSPSS